MWPLPSTADLVEALRQPGESYEALAGRLPVSMSTVNRWKVRSPEEWATFLYLLDLAGWLDEAAISRDLQEGEEPALDPVARQEQEARRLRDHDGLEPLTRRLEASRPAPPARKRDRG